jgi:dTDP-4-dehydrorhamnose reductase
MSGEGEASFHDVARACVRLLHLEDRMEITAAKTSAVAAADVAPRPARVVMSNEKLKRTGLYCQRYWQDALAEYLSRPWFEKLFRSVRSDRDSRHS